MLEIIKHENGPRVYLLKRYRLHHFTFGLILSAIGGILIWHDRKDYRVCFKFNDRKVV